MPLLIFFNAFAIQVLIDWKLLAQLMQPVEQFATIIPALTDVVLFRTGKPEIERFARLQILLQTVLRTILGFVPFFFLSPEEDSGKIAQCFLDLFDLYSSLPNVILYF